MEYSLLELLTIKHEKTERGIKETKEEVGSILFITYWFLFNVYMCLCDFAHVCARMLCPCACTYVWAACRGQRTICKIIWSSPFSKSYWLEYFKSDINNPQHTEIIELKSSSVLNVNENTTVNIVAAPTCDGWYFKWSKEWMETDWHHFYCAGGYLL